jgi:hypothetical protein
MRGGALANLFAVEPDGCTRGWSTLKMITEWSKDIRVVSFVMVIFHSGNVERVSFTKIHPESNPPSAGSQGLLPVDWVTEWFPGLGQRGS